MYVPHRLRLGPHDTCVEPARRILRSLPLATTTGTGTGQDDSSMDTYTSSGEGSPERAARK